MNMKYIRFIDGTFVLFSASLSHETVARRMHGLDDPVEYMVESAGFIGYWQDEICCHGESISLHKRSLPEDTELLRLQIYPHL
jgi:hypothetical protein